MGGGEEEEMVWGRRLKFVWGCGFYYSVYVDGRFRRPSNSKPQFPNSPEVSTQLCLTIWFSRLLSYFITRVRSRAPQYRRYRVNITNVFVNGRAGFVRL